MEPPLFKGRRFALWREGREDPLRPGEQAWAGEDVLVDLARGVEADPAEVSRYISDLERLTAKEADDSVSNHTFEFEGRRYGFRRGSDVIDDGMTLELGPLTDDNLLEDILIEIFYSDQDGSFTVDLRERLPLELVERSIAAAKALLPPIAGV